MPLIYQIVQPWAEKEGVSETDAQFYYQLRNAKVAALAEVGASRWGDSENAM